MAQIIELKPEIYNRIAAGEVVENPASIVKELLENSIDAESSEIEINIKQAGKKEITIVDNGYGMNKDDLYLAIKKHTTSKIKNVKDLNNIKTFGFRGEALSSIISVSIVELTSKTKQMDMGIKLIIENAGSKIIENKVSLNKGTSIKVSHLFHNTPARLKFLKNDKKELLNIKQTINSLIIPHYTVNFKVQYEDQNPVIYKAKKSILDRIKDVYGEEFISDLIEFKNINSEFKLFGYISKPSFNKSNKNYQFLYLNNRPIVTKFFNYWLTIAYENLLMKQRYPIAFIFLEAPPTYYDVNVHPAKREVRFINEHYISQTIIHNIKSNLNKELFIPEIKNINQPREKEINKKKYIKEVNTTINRFLSDFQNEEVFDNNIKKKNSKNTFTSLEALYNVDYLSLFNTYIIFEMINENTVYLIDQHAAHERILYERIKRDSENAEEISQNLLIPIHLQLSNVEYQVVMDHLDIFQDIGYQIEDFGGQSIILKAIPSYFQNIDDKQLFLDVLSDIMENKTIDKIRLKDDIISSIACRSAIKAGDRISEIEKQAIIKDLMEIENRYTCPHGRPAVIKLTKQELEKWFKRK